MLSTLALIAALLAQDGVTRGDALRRREFRTFAPVTLFVDPTGNDTNACTSSGTAACATVNGAIAKLPKIIQHNVTINVAAGTYAGFTVSNFIFTAPTTTTLNFTIEGAAMQTFTPSTGSATGTVTTISNTNSMGLLGDSGQTWTTNELAGRFVRMTSGTQSGQRRGIFANTSTSLETVPQWLTLPAPGDTYVIETPSTIFNTTSTVAGTTGTAQILLTSFSGQVSASNALLLDCRGNSPSSGVTLRGLRLETSVSVALNVFGCRIQGSAGGDGSPAVVFGGSGAAGAVSFISSQWIQNQWAGTNLLVIAPATSTTPSLISLNAGHTGLWSGLYVNSLSTSPSQVLVQASFNAPQSQALGAGGTAAFAWVARCALSTQTAFALSGPGRIASLSSQPQVIFSCGQAFDIQQGLDITLNPTCIATSTCISSGNGGRVRLLAPPTLIGVTTDYRIDGQPYSEAVISTLSPIRVLGAGGSVVQRP